MKIFQFIYITLVVVLLAACGGDKAENARQAPIQPVSNATPAAPAPTTPATTATTPPPPAEPAQNAAGVWHYTCPNGHAGGGGSATPCGECGTTLVHNQAYHGNTTATTPTATGGAPTPVPGGTPATMFADPTKTPVNATVGAAPAAAAAAPEPAQNASGVWHYTCSNGCSGGAGSATACSQCGSTLAHNQAYHN